MIRRNDTASRARATRFRMFVRRRDGRWCVVSMRTSVREAQWTADLVVDRQGFIASPPP